MLAWQCFQSSVKENFKPVGKQNMSFPISGPEWVWWVTMMQQCGGCDREAGLPGQSWAAIFMNESEWSCGKAVERPPPGRCRTPRRPPASRTIRLTASLGQFPAINSITPHRNKCPFSITAFCHPNPAKSVMANSSLNLSGSKMLKIELDQDYKDIL